MKTDETQDRLLSRLQKAENLRGTQRNAVLLCLRTGGRKNREGRRITIPNMNVEQGDTIAFPFGKFEVRELGDEVARAEAVSSDYIPEGETIPLRRESFGAREKEAESIDELVEKARDRAEPTYIVNEERRVEAFGMVMIEVTPVDKQHQVGGQIGRELAELGFQWVGAHTDHRGAPAASFSTQGEGKAEVTEVNEYGEGKMKPIEGGEDE